jgi:hypothetical protein
LKNVVRFDEAIELRESQRAAIPLEGGETARFALPTGINSEEAQPALILALDPGVENGNSLALQVSQQQFHLRMNTALAVQARGMDRDRAYGSAEDSGNILL